LKEKISYFNATEYFSCCEDDYDDDIPLSSPDNGSVKGAEN